MEERHLGPVVGLGTYDTLSFDELERALRTGRFGREDPA